MAKTKDLNQRLYYLGLSLIINSAGNALAISTNLGSAVWTASAVNLSNLTAVSLGTTLFIYGVVVTLLNQLLLGTFDRRRFFSNLIFTVPFSYLIALFQFIFKELGVPTYDFAIRICLDVLGLFMVAVAVSLYSRANLFMHPNDDLTYIIRFKYIHGNPVLSQWVSYLPPVLVILTCYWLAGKTYAVGFGTIFALLFQGAMMGWADTHAFTKLKHHIDL
ncbi:YczE/YyaS/YitT family protein [Lentilactobacillus sp. SPB1-3]|uniref:YitT family protein n=1 Tax=Lentilactobacillus terminaliae TaxID=3003483 RepID=A0ACD5DEZ2_9LACO|nr:hypothetical protein [Lentilactobacillus sp. SPB1-3]MCZ0977495.1 hypothetical protein [Lentilactobacillus sp. SPB1-3]